MRVPSVVSACLLILALPLGAAVTNVAWYHLGEADPGATIGATANATTVDSVGGVNLTRTGSPVYAAGTYGALTPSPLAVAFPGGDGSNDIKFTGPIVSTATDNFGLEAWVKANSTDGNNALIAYNGSTGTSGWGLYRTGSQWGYLFGGVVLQSDAAINVGAWTHIAIVRSGGITTMYINGQPSSTSGSAPNTPSGSMRIGQDVSGPLINEVFNGTIDEVRVFTFSPGAFQRSDLNYNFLLVPTLDARALMALAVVLAVIGAIAIRYTR